MRPTNSQLVSRSQLSITAHILTCQDEWDAVSKQPRFKSGAVRVEKCVQKENGKEAHAKEQNNDAIARAQEKHGKETNQQSGNRVRRLEVWLGATHEGLETLVDIYKSLLPRLIHDFEVHSGIQELTTITQNMLKNLRPIIEIYHESRQYGRNVCHNLRETLFPPPDSPSDPYEALAALQSLQLFLTYVEGHFIALNPASQALWDEEFINIVNFCTKEVERQKAWLAQQVKVRSPQTLLVPMSLPDELHTGVTGLEGSLRGSRSVESSKPKHTE